ncbi:MAG: hypothetical protein ABI693_22800 [Bryobacteraceae bacterium]
MAVRQSVNILPHVAQFVAPGLRYVPGPKGARFIVVRPDHNQMDTPGRQVPRRFSAETTFRRNAKPIPGMRLHGETVPKPTALAESIPVRAA